MDKFLWSIRCFAIVIAFSSLDCLSARLQLEQPDVEPLASGEQLDFFEREIRPLLVQHCFECHSVNAGRLKAGLYLDSRQAMLKGGDSGPALVPSNARESLLVQAVRYDGFEMPPKGKLPAKEIEALTKWVEMGAMWPKENPMSDGPVREVFDLQKRKASHWAWQPVQNPPPPIVTDELWPTSTIDRFILSGLEHSGLKPSAQADKYALVRRLYFAAITRISTL